MIGQTLGHYKILDKLGAGGMGEVYRAEDTTLDREVALKILPPDLADSQERLDRFQREAKTLAALDHPNIVHIYTVEQEDGIRFLTMQLVEGKPLSQLIPKGGMPLERIFEIAIPLADAIATAHEKGVIHRDLKPANIMVTDEGRVKVLDFGLAKLREEAEAPLSTELPTEPLTEEGRIVGTMPYMSPEQLGGSEADRRSDIFSLGVIFFEMATGRRPFLGATNVEIAASILRESPPPVEELRADLPHHLSRIVGRCLRKDPRRRWQSAKDLCNDLEDLAEEIHIRASESKAEETSPSVAVLPFVDRSENHDQGHFTDGLAEDLINAFSKIHGVQVPARTSSFSFKDQNLDVRDIGSRLRVASVLEGSVQKHGERLRVTANLIETETGFTLWSQKFDRNLDDLFQVQDEITRSIIAELEVPLRREELALLSSWADQRVDQKVYDVYLQARAAWADRFKGRLKEAQLKFHEVISEEPEWALAYSGLADCYTLFGWYTYQPSEEAFGEAEKYSRKALKLDPENADAHASEALIQTLFHWNWKAAEDHFKESLRRKPNNPAMRWWYSFLLVIQGRIEEALKQGDHARTREDPFSRLIHANIGWLQHLAGDTPAALAQLQAAAEHWPEFALTYVFLGWVQEEQGNLDEAMDAWRAAQREFGRLGTAMPSLALQEAHTLARLGKREEARALLEKCDAMAALDERVYFSPAARAAVHIALGEIEQALEFLAHAEEIHDCWLLVLANDPRFRPLREQRNEEFTQLLGRIGLPERG